MAGETLFVVYQSKPIDLDNVLFGRTVHSNSPYGIESRDPDKIGINSQSRPIAESLKRFIDIALFAALWGAVTEARVRHDDVSSKPTSRVRYQVCSGAATGGAAKVTRRALSTWGQIGVSRRSDGPW